VPKENAITDGQAYEAAFEVVNGQLCALIDPIYSLTATTRDGLAVQAASITASQRDIHKTCWMRTIDTSMTSRSPWARPAGREHS
jgi:hypothetical protein